MTLYELDRPMVTHNIDKVITDDAYSVFSMNICNLL